MPSAFIEYIEYSIKTKCYISVQLFDRNLEMLLFLEVKKYFYFNGHIVSLWSLWAFSPKPSSVCWAAVMGGGGTVSEFDVCMVERMCFREEETSQQIRFSLVGGGGGVCQSPRVAARLGLTGSEVDFRTFQPPEGKLAGHWTRFRLDDNQTATLQRHKILFDFGSGHRTSQIHQVGDDQNKSTD